MNPCVTSSKDVISDTDKELAGSERSLSMARRRLQRGSLYETKSGGFKVWRVKYMQRYKMAGGEEKIIRKDELVGTFTQFPTKKLAQRAVDERLADMNSTNYQPSYLVKFGAMVSKWETMVMPQHKLLTRRGEAVQLRILRASFVDTLLHEMRRETIQLWISETAEKYSPKSVRNLLSTLRLIWQSAQDWGYVAEEIRSPFERLKLPKKQLVQVPCFTVEQVRAIIQKADEPFKTMFWILAETGMRGGEVCGLFRDDIDTGNCVIRVKRSAALGSLQTPKTGNAIRTCPISRVLADHLKWFLDQDIYTGNGSGMRRETTSTEYYPLVFRNIHGEPLNNYNVCRYTLKPILDEIGITDNKRFGLHAFRHANISAMDSMRTPAKVLQERVGHADHKTSMGYMHAYSADHLEAAAKLGELFMPKQLPEMGNTIPVKPVNVQDMTHYTENGQAIVVGAD